MEKNHQTTLTNRHGEMQHWYLTNHLHYQRIHNPPKDGKLYAKWTVASEAATCMCGLMHQQLAFCSLSFINPSTNSWINQFNNYLPTPRFHQKSRFQSRFNKFNHGLPNFFSRHPMGKNSSTSALCQSISATLRRWHIAPPNIVNFVNTWLIWTICVQLNRWWYEQLWTIIWTWTISIHKLYPIIIEECPVRFTSTTSLLRWILWTRFGMWWFCGEMLGDFAKLVPFPSFWLDGFHMFSPPSYQMVTTKVDQNWRSSASAFARFTCRSRFTCGVGQLAQFCCHDLWRELGYCVRFQGLKDLKILASSQMDN